MLIHILLCFFLSSASSLFFHAHKRFPISSTIITTANTLSTTRLHQSAPSLSSTNTEISVLKTEILQVLNRIIDPLTGDDIITAGCLNPDDLEILPNDGIVRFKMSNSVGGDSNSNNELKNYIVDEISKLSWVKTIQTPRGPTPPSTTQQASSPQAKPLQELALPATNGLQNVKNIIAVSSCKGGVGKSTVSVNLAYTLMKAGAKVGILDADIYGPSLPTMTKPSVTDVVYNNNKLLPLEYEGVKLMSMGFINKGASIMRGPMVNQILNQFVSLCDWGELDYLIVDMPPGTGDIQLTLSQIMNISAAVIVTTPQRLSFVDVVKGIDLFDTVNIPCVAVVENMAEYSTYEFSKEFYENINNQITGLYTAMLLSSSSSATKQDLLNSIENTSESVTNILQPAIENQKINKKIFGDGHIQRLKDMWGIDDIIRLPLIDEVSKCGDKGVPYILEFPKSDIAYAMVDLASAVLSELARLEALSNNDNDNNDSNNSIDSATAPNASTKPSAKATASTATDVIQYDPNTNEIIYKPQRNAKQILVNPYNLRINCRCATCIEEFTGERLLDTSTVPPLVKPLNMNRIGRYAVAIDWSDGHKSLFPYKAIANLAATAAAASTTTAATVASTKIDMNVP